MFIIGFVLGTILGSFVKALADRSLDNKSFWGRSYCPKCQHKLAWYDLFPVISFSLLAGKCRYCHKKIEIEYLLVEVVMGVLIAYLFAQSYDNFQLFVIARSEATRQSSELGRFLTKFGMTQIIELISKIFFITVLAVLFLTDLKKMFIPDRIVLPAIVIGIVLNLITVILKSSIEPFLLSLLTGLAIGGFFLSLIIITRGKGMGGGDVKLGAFIGLILGFPQSLLAILTGFILGAVFSIGLIITGKKHFGQSIPFGPFLVLGSLIALFWGQEIINWYLKLG